MNGNQLRVVMMVLGGTGFYGVTHRTHLFAVSDPLQKAWVKTDCRASQREKITHIVTLFIASVLARATTFVSKIYQQGRNYGERLPKKGQTARAQRCL